MNVLVLPEDFKKDQYMLKPLVEAMMKNIGKRATVRVCQDPRFGGISQVLDVARILEVVDKYSSVDLFLICVDRDGEVGRKDSLGQLEQRVQPAIRPSQILIAENAWQEIEVWVLAGCRDFKTSKGEAWKTHVRRHRDPKEHYYLPYARKRGILGHLEQGRKTLGEEAGKNYHRVCQLCPEVRELEVRIESWIKSRDDVM